MLLNVRRFHFSKIYIQKAFHVFRASVAKTNKKGLSGMLRPVSSLVNLSINAGFRFRRFGKRQYHFPEG